MLQIENKSHIHSLSTHTLKVYHCEQFLYILPEDFYVHTNIYVKNFKLCYLVGLIFLHLTLDRSKDRSRQMGGVDTTLYRAPWC